MSERDKARDELRTYLPEYLAERYGITDLRRNFTCLNPEHEDRHPSMSYDEAHARVKCFSCGATYDLLDLLQMEPGISSYTEALREGCRRYSIDLEGGQAPRPVAAVQPVKASAGEDEAKAARYARQIEEAAARFPGSPAQAYLEARGISAETAEYFRAGYCPDFMAGNGAKWEALIIPTGEANYTARNLNPNAGDKERYQNRGTAHLFNARALSDTSSGTVYIVEGEIDAMAVAEAGGDAVALGSTANTRLLMEAVKAAAAGRVYSKQLNICLDKDSAGEKAAALLIKELLALKAEDPQKYAAFNVRQEDISGKYKDPAERLEKDRNGLIDKLQGRANADEIAEYKLQASATARLLAFCDGLTDAANTPPIPTGYNALDEALGGGLRGKALYTVPAGTSLGKTTFALQMAENISAAGNDVLYISLEMGAEELIAKGLSRHTFLLDESPMRRNAKTAYGISDGTRWAAYSEAELDLIVKATEAYRARSENLYFYEGAWASAAGSEPTTALDVVRAIEKHHEMTGRFPVVIVDYVQILAPRDPKATDKQAMDDAARTLKAAAVLYNVPIVALCSINRMNYEESINLAALKESGALEYGSDVVLGLQLYGIEKEKKGGRREWIEDRRSEDTRHIEAKILKNRHGRVTSGLLFDYYTPFNHFEEVKG